MSKEEKIKKRLSELLENCLEYENQGNSFEVLKVDLENEKFIVSFDIVEVPEDDYIGFTGY